jgi:hypothetical protein
MKLTELEALAKAATPGPWEKRANGVVISMAMPDEKCIVFWDDDGRNRVNDYPFIAAANPETILALCTLVREMGEALDRLARLGNEPDYGNSIGNQIAQAALAKYKEVCGE